MDVLRFIREDIRSTKYSSVEPLEAIAKEVNIPVLHLVKLNANENPYGTHPDVAAALTTVPHHVYPDPDQIKVREALAERLNTTIEHIVCGSGSDDILDFLIRLVGPKTVIISTPTFGMYKFLGNIAGVQVVDVPRLADFSVDIAAVKRKIKETKATIAFFPSPNNPTGTILTNEDVLSLVEEKDCLIVVDEAYAEFSDTSAVDLVPLHDNLVVTRTFSKWAGLAGLRFGYMIAHQTIVSYMLAIKQPYNVSTAAEVAVLTSLAKVDHLEATVELIKEERTRFFKLLSEVSWLRPIPSQGNFILAEVLGTRSAFSVYSSLRKRGIIIRFFGSQGGNLQNYIRISVGRPQDTDRVMEVLHELDEEEISQTKHAFNTMAGVEAVLFDMDGVLADVTHSQHKCIIDTAALYGVKVTEDDITKAKAAGNANNDWKVTLRLVEAAGQHPTLDELTEKYEEIYQGTENRTGLWSVETLLVEKSLLEILATKFKLAIVTGRPRRDAERFLTQHGLTDLFPVLVCMGEAASKPSPEPVTLALQKINAKKAIFIGDTVDDIRSGVAAGVTPLGVVAPSVADIKKEAENLYASGAVFVMLPACKDLALLLDE